MQKEFKIEINGAQIAGEALGDGEPLLFLHAGVADRRMWRPQMAELSDSHRAIAYDRRGFGETTTTNEAFSNVEDLRVVLNDLGLQSVSLIGCSQGGRLAIDFALAYPERVNKLVLIAPAVSGAPAPQAYPPGVEEMDAEMDAAEDVGNMQRVNEIEAQLWLDGPSSAPGRVGGAPRDLFLDMNGIALAMPDLEEEIEPPSAYDRVSELSLPVLMLWGDLDFPHVIERSRYLAETIPGAVGIEIAGTAHLPNLEQPQLMNSLLGKFL